MFQDENPPGNFSPSVLSPTSAAGDSGFAQDHKTRYLGAWCSDLHHFPLCPLPCNKSALPAFPEQVEVTVIVLRGRASCRKGMYIEQKCCRFGKDRNPWAGGDEDVDGFNQKLEILVRTLKERKDSDTRQSWGC